MDQQEDFQQYLQPTPFIDSDHPRVVAYSRALVDSSASAVERAVALYYAVRDDIRYDPYHLKLDLKHLKASHTLATGLGFCISKAVLLAAACRAVGIASRLGFADVRNHLNSPKLAKSMQTDLFVFHGYTDIFLEGSWVKATPAFNASMCELVDVKPLAFDGRSDSIFQPFDTKGHKHLEYVNDHGTFADLPLPQIIAAFRRNYPARLVDSMLASE